MARTAGVSTNQFYDRVAELHKELHVSAMYVQQLELRQSHSFLPEKIAWPATPSEEELWVFHQWVSSEFTLTLEKLGKIAAAKFGDNKWAKKTKINDTMKKVKRWNAYLWIKKFIEMGISQSYEITPDS